MPIAEATPTLTRALALACDRAGLDPAGARLIHHYANAVFHLPAHDAVARVTSDAGRGDNLRNGIWSVPG